MKIYKPQAITEIGKRPNQEDAIFPSLGNASSEDRLFIVCDGMGGHESGEVASNSVSQNISSFLKDANPDTFSIDDFRNALIYAYNQIDDINSTSQNSEKKMGTTLTFLYLGNKHTIIAHIGDSRVYQLRPTENGAIDIIHKTNDHSWINLLLRNGDITEEEAKNHPLKNNITRAIQPNLEDRCKATLYETCDVKDGDYFFLCSDGILESIDDDLLKSILATDESDEEKLNKIKEICGKNSRDNHSAYLIHIEEGLNILTPNNEISTKSHSLEIDPNILEAEDADKLESINVPETPHSPNIYMDTTPKKVNKTTNKNTPKGGGKNFPKRPFSKGFIIGLAAAIVLLIGGIILFLYCTNEDNKQGNKEVPKSTTTKESKKDSNSEKDKEEKTTPPKITIEIKNDKPKARSYKSSPNIKKVSPPKRAKKDRTTSVNNKTNNNQNSGSKKASSINDSKGSKDPKIDLVLPGLGGDNNSSDKK